MIRALSSPNVFAGNVEVMGDVLQCGILFLNTETFHPGIHVIYNRDNESEFYRVDVPRMPTPSRDVELRIVNADQH